MKKSTYKKLLTLTVFTMINSYNLTSVNGLLKLPNHVTDAYLEQPQQTSVQWKTTDVLVRALTGQWDATDEWALGVLEMPSMQDGFVAMILAIFQNPSITSTPITDETVSWFESARENIKAWEAAGKIIEDEAIICFGLLPDATPEELFNAGEKILEINPTYTNAAAKCFRTVAEHPDASIENIINAGQSLIELDGGFQALGTEILLAAADLPEIEPDRIEEIIEEFIRLEDKNPRTIARLCHQLFNHPDSNSTYKLHAANYVATLDEDYYEESAAMYQKLLTLYPENSVVLETIANAFKFMGKEFKNDQVTTLNTPL